MAHSPNSIDLILTTNICLIKLQQDAVGETDFAPRAATKRSRPSNVVCRPTGVAIWRTELNIQVVLDSGLIHALYENMTSSTKPEVHNVSHCHQKRIELRTQVTCTKNLVKFGLCFSRHASRQTDKETDRHADYNTSRPYWGSNKM